MLDTGCVISFEDDSEITRFSHANDIFIQVGIIQLDETLETLYFIDSEIVRGKNIEKRVLSMGFKIVDYMYVLKMDSGNTIRNVIHKITSITSSVPVSMKLVNGRHYLAVSMYKHDLGNLTKVFSSFVREINSFRIESVSTIENLKKLMSDSVYGGEVSEVSISGNIPMLEREKFNKHGESWCGYLKMLRQNNGAFELVNIGPGGNDMTNNVDLVKLYPVELEPFASLRKLLYSGYIVTYSCWVKKSGKSIEITIGTLKADMKSTIDSISRFIKIEDKWKFVISKVN